MKNLFCFNLIIVGCYLMSVEGASNPPTKQQILYETYLNKVIKRFAHHFEKIPVFGSGLPIEDIDFQINNKSCKDVQDISGEVHFYDGFVVKIKEITPVDKNIIIQSSITDKNATLESEFYFKNVHIAYDVTMKFGDFIDNGTIEFDFGVLKWTITIFSDFSTGKVKATLKSFGTQLYEVGVRAFPYNYYMQVIACAKSQLILASDDEPNLLKSIKNWDLSKLIQTAAEEAGPPVLCYDDCY